MTTRVSVIALFGAMLAILPACGATEDGRVRAGADRLEHDGVSIELPPGWNGRVLALDYPAAVLQAANFETAEVGFDPQAPIREDGSGGPVLDVFNLESGGEYPGHRGPWTLVVTKRSQEPAVVRIDLGFRSS